MRGKDDLPTGFTDKPNGWKGKENPGIIGDPIFLVHGNIKIDSNKHPLPFKINLVYGSNGHLSPGYNVILSDQRE
jgi:hypothetical protein